MLGDKIVDVFCIVDNFCKEFAREIAKHCLGCASLVMTIMPTNTVSKIVTIFLFSCFFID